VGCTRHVTSKLLDDFLLWESFVSIAINVATLIFLDTEQTSA
jgi:hypothetical protein